MTGNPSADAGDDAENMPAPPVGEADTPGQAHDETAADVRALRHGDTIPQTDLKPGA